MQFNCIYLVKKTVTARERTGRTDESSKMRRKEGGCEEKGFLDSRDFCFAFVERFTVVMFLYLESFAIFSFPE